MRRPTATARADTWCRTPRTMSRRMWRGTSPTRQAAKSKLEPLEPTAPTHQRRIHALTVPLQGYLLPFYHQHYWVGLRASMPFAFRWVDPYSPAPASDTYQNWGTAGTKVPEPNNLLGWVLQLSLGPALSATAPQPPGLTRSRTRLKPRARARAGTSSAAWRTTASRPTLPGAGRTRAATGPTSSCAASGVSGHA